MGGMGFKNVNRSESVNRRLLEYKNILKKLKGLGFSRVSSSNLADSLNVSASLVRKDFLTLSTAGNKRGGYQIQALLDEINSVLHKGAETKAVLVGIGKLGSALLGYQGFLEENIQFSAAFDVDAEKLSMPSPIPCYHVDRLPEIIRKENILVGVLAVPGPVAQRTADLMTQAGVKGILNFTPVHLAVPANCYENQINLAIELERVVLQVS